MKSSLLHIFLLLAVTVSSLAQSNNTKAKPTLAYSTDPTVYTLGGVNIDGINDEQEVNRLIAMAGLIVGQEITFPKADNEITKAVRNLWNQRMFSDITITADSIVGNDIYLHIQLTAHPQLSEVNYNGIKKTEREDLEEKLKLRPGNQISVDVIDRIKYIIHTFFEDKGFKNVDIEVMQRDDPKNPNHVLLDINIDKNEKVKVHRIYFTGADQALQKSLKRAMKKTREVGKLRNFFSSKKFIEEKYTADKLAVVSKYN